MARGGSRGRTYNRDARGRFASGGSASSGIRRGAKKASGGTLAARSRLARSKQRLAAQSPADTSIRGTLSRRSQKGAVTRAAKAVAEARKANRVRLPGVKPKGVIRKGKGRKKGEEKAPPAMSQRQVSGIRRRSSEKPDTALKRRSERARKRLDQLLDESRSLQTSLNRRRGRIEGSQRETAKTELRKVERSITRLRNAVKSYETPKPVVGSGGRAPVTTRALEARYRMLQRRVGYIARNKDDFPEYDATGRASYGGPLRRAQQEMNKAFMDMIGRGVSVRNRTKRQATSAQRSRTQRVFDTAARAKRQGSAAPAVKPSFRRGVSRQGNLLTGRFDRVVSGPLRPLFGRIF